jgi:hypothetical protein
MVTGTTAWQLNAGPKAVTRPRRWFGNADGFGDFMETRQRLTSPYGRPNLTVTLMQGNHGSVSSKSAEICGFCASPRPNPAAAAWRVCLKQYMDWSVSRPRRQAGRHGESAESENRSRRSGPSRRRARLAARRCGRPRRADSALAGLAGRPPLPPRLGNQGVQRAFRRDGLLCARDLAPRGGAVCAAQCGGTRAGRDICGSGSSASLSARRFSRFC